MPLKQWLKCHRTQGNAVPPPQFMTQGVPYLNFLKICMGTVRTGFNIGGEVKYRIVWADCAYILIMVNYTPTVINGREKGAATGNRGYSYS